MTHKGGFEAVNKTLQDILINNDMMDEVTLLLIGDLRKLY